MTRLSTLWRKVERPVRGLELFEVPTDALGRVNLWITRMAIVAVVAIWVMWTMTETM